jgi:surface protein
MSLAAAYIFGRKQGVDNSFVMVVDTSKAGSASDSFELTGAVGDYDVVAKQSGVEVETFSNLSGEQTITFSNGAGIYTLELTPKEIGGFNRIKFNNGGDKLKITDITSWGNIAWSNFERAFFGCSNMTVTATNAPNLSSVTNMFVMFFNCASLSTLDVSNWDVSNITNMSLSFRNCPINTLDVSNWDVSNVINISQMFSNCSSLTTLDVSNWDVSSITNISNMFRDCSSLTTLDVSNWDVSSITNMNSMFYGATNINTSFANWIINNVTDFSSFMQFTTGLSTANYDATLIGWKATLQATYPNGSGYTPTISINFGGSQFTSGGAAETARTSLINNFNWTIGDGGAV